MASCTKLRPRVSQVVERKKSTYMMKLTTHVAISAIAQRRRLFGADNFRSMAVKNVDVPLLKDDAPRPQAAWLMERMKESFMAIEMAYVRRLAFCIYEKVNDPRSLLECYSFTYDYCNEGVSFNGKNKRTLFLETNLTIEKSLIRLTNHLFTYDFSSKILPANYCISLHVFYFDEVPSSYTLNGFSRIDLLDEKILEKKPVVFGNFETPFHRLKIEGFFRAEIENKTSAVIDNEKPKSKVDENVKEKSMKHINKENEIDKTVIAETETLFEMEIDNILPESDKVQADIENFDENANEKSMEHINKENEIDKTVIAETETLFEMEIDNVLPESDKVQGDIENFVKNVEESGMEQINRENEIDKSVIEDSEPHFERETDNVFPESDREQTDVEDLLDEHTVQMINPDSIEKSNVKNTTCDEIKISKENLKNYNEMMESSRLYQKSEAFKDLEKEMLSLTFNDVLEEDYYNQEAAVKEEQLSCSQRSEGSLFRPFEPSEPDHETFKINCLCKNKTSEDQDIITCSICFTREHAACYGILPKDINFFMKAIKHVCATCASKNSTLKCTDISLVYMKLESKVRYCKVRKAAVYCLKRTRVNDDNFRLAFGLSKNDASNMIRLLERLHFFYPSSFGKKQKPSDFHIVNINELKRNIIPKFFQSFSDQKGAKKVVLKNFMKLSLTKNNKRKHGKENEPPCVVKKGKLAKK